MKVFSPCWHLTVLLAWFVTSQAASGTVEVDLVFPQNDTYAPAPIIPVVFAFQHSDLAGYIQPSIEFSILPYGNWTRGLAQGYFEMTWANFTSSDPYIEYGEALEVLNTKGVWMIVWKLNIAQCFASGDLNIIGDYRKGLVVFTTKNGAQKPDLIAAGQQRGTCSADQGFAFTISDTRDSGDFFENRKPCAVLAETTPAPTPSCGATVNAMAASSISSYLTYRACIIPALARPWCPEPNKGAARALMVPRMVVAGVWRAWQRLLAGWGSWP